MAEVRLSGFKDWPLELDQILIVLEQNKIAYIVIGGFAGLIQGMPLPTYDLDIMLSTEPKNHQKFLETMAELEAIALSEHRDEDFSAKKSLANQNDISFLTKYGYLDIVAAPAGVTSYGRLHRDSTEIEITPGIAPRVASLRDIIHSKRTAGRDRDKAKLVALETLLMHS